MFKISGCVHGPEILSSGVVILVLFLVVIPGNCGLLIYTAYNSTVVPPRPIGSL